MAHETHHESHTTHADNAPRTSFRSSFWFVLIIVGLFVAAVNFVNVMGHDEGGHDAVPHGNEHATHPTREATSSQTLEGETGIGVPAEHTTESASPAHGDSTADHGTGH